MFDSIFADAFDLKPYIKKRALEIEDLEERRIYKALSETFMQKLYEQSKESLMCLEAQVFDEVKMGDYDFSIYMGMTDLSHYDATAQSMFPIYAEDAEPFAISDNEVLTALQEIREYPLYSVFIQTDYINIKEIEESGRIYDGTIKTDKGEYKATFSLKKEHKYFQKLNGLHQSFLLNGIQWETVCSAYLEKMFTLYLTGADKISPGEKILEVLPDFLEHEKIIKTQRILLWNLEVQEENSSTNPVACEDKINYEHIISGYCLQKDCPYLVANTDILVSNVRRSKNSLTITCQTPNAHAWVLYKFHQNPQNIYDYPMLSNRNKESFMNSLARHYQQNVKTKAEIKRIIEAADLGDYLSYQGLELDGEKSGESLTYDVEGFIEEKIPYGIKHNRMVLYFLAAKEEHYLNYDLMSYLVTKIQKIFPEYECMGRLRRGVG